jgi:hypothetical protein
MCHDAQTNEIIADCPGFSDTRSAAFDIAATTLTKYLVDNMKKVKVVISVNYNSVRKGVDRIQFTDLLEHLVQFLKVDNKYRDSIGMIVTKVDSEYFNLPDVGLTMTLDSVIINRIAKFLREVKTELNQRSTVDENLTSKISLIDILLAKTDQEYPRIQLFRRPDKAGSVDQIDLLQNCKPKLRKLVFNDLSYTSVDKNDFGFSLSSKSKFEIVEMIERSNDKIRENIEKILQMIVRHYDDLINASQDYFDLEMNLKALYHDLDSSLSNKKAKVLSFQEFCTVVHTLIEKYNIQIPNELFKAIEDEIRYRSLLESVTTDIELVNNKRLENFQAPEMVREVVQFILRVSKWYTFIIHSFSRLSRYNAKENMENAETLKSDHFKQLLIELNFFDYSAESIDFRQSELKSLEHLVAATLEDSMKSKCLDNGSQLIDGNYIKISEAKKLFKDCDGRSSMIYIVAAHTVFVDSNLDLFGKEKKLIIFAPKWEVKGVFHFNLDGISNTERYYTTGQGVPGGAAGVFFGVGNQFINGNDLTISAVGGNGGNGRNGQDGKYDINRIFTIIILIFLMPSLEMARH